MSCLPIRAWNVCISGFLQDESRLTGILALWRRLHQEQSDPDTRVELRTWRENWSALAECIWLLRPDEGGPRINVFGYSWGGHSAVLLARELDRRGLAVENLVLCDAVYRHGYWLGNWRALVPWSRIVVPANVRRVRWFRQRRSLPCGHAIVAEDPQETVVHPAVEADVAHGYMDELPEFQAVCRMAARSTQRRSG